MEQLETLHSRRLWLGAGAHLYAQGAQVAETVTLCSGWLLLYRTLPNGARHVIHIALPGDFMGRRPNSKAPLRHGVVALTDCTCCVFPPLEEVASRYPELALRMASLYARDKASREEYLTYVARGHAPERLAFLVLDLFRRLRKRGLSRGNTIPFPLTQEDMGDALGLTPVHVSRVLRQWRDQGWIAIRKRSLTILDYPALCQLAGTA